MTINKRLRENTRDPAILALEAMAWILSDDDRAQRLLALTGLTPDGLREAAMFAETQTAVLDFLCAHEPDLVAASEALQITPEALAAAREGLD